MTSVKQIDYDRASRGVCEMSGPIWILIGSRAKLAREIATGGRRYPARLLYEIDAVRCRRTTRPHICLPSTVHCNAHVFPQAKTRENTFNAFYLAHVNNMHTRRRIWLITERIWLINLSWSLFIFDRDVRKLTTKLVIQITVIKINKIIVFNSLTYTHVKHFYIILRKWLLWE